MIRNYKSHFTTEDSEGRKIVPQFVIKVIDKMDDFGKSELSLCFSIRELKTMLNLAHEWEDDGQKRK